MGMAGPDIVLFVAGLLLFAGAGYALVQQGGTDAITGGGSPTSVYSVLFPLSEVDVATEPVADFASATTTIPVNQTNVKSVTVTLQCTDALPGNTFNIRLTVTPPASIEAPEPKFGRCGETFELDIPVSEVPPSTVVQGATREEAEASLTYGDNATRAVGDWAIAITGSRGGGPLPIGVPAANPGGSIVVTAETWTPELTPVVR